jgi:hypothetical protein
VPPKTQVAVVEGLLLLVSSLLFDSASDEHNRLGRHSSSPEDVATPSERMASLFSGIGSRTSPRDINGARDVCESFPLVLKDLRELRPTASARNPRQVR